ncbi:hypothetical protein BDF22DRAFT_698545 [Syncephalis plumigaleata]|nr:hypothetical protein BDF22DRAFT_698545 [Syncephalis plumigaleata]
MTEQQHSTTTKENKPTRSYSILLTGFEPFGTPRPPTNPSWELLRPLNDTILELDSNDDDDGTCRVHLHCRELPVVYKDIHRIMPILHHSSSSTEEQEQVKTINYDMYIHIGQGHPDKVSLEQQARHGPYTKPDNHCRIPQHACCKGQDHDPNYPRHQYHQAYRTHINVPALKTWLATQCSWSHVEVSEDPGLYLCEYVYYHSLHFSHAMANPHHHDEEEENEHHQGKPILFIHVPIPPSPYTVEQLTALVRDAVEWLTRHYLMSLQ